MDKLLSFPHCDNLNVPKINEVKQILKMVFIYFNIYTPGVIKCCKMLIISNVFIVLIKFTVLASKSQANRPIPLRMLITISLNFQEKKLQNFKKLCLYFTLQAYISNNPYHCLKGRGSPSCLPVIIRAQEFIVK